ncbi:uncharacterized protein LOC117341041 [Pecten maximus]|uniref:uncharacterized protein LOC117341041 n=1 Tax=Pecten maximus TaxID=6579 RepID=UPI001458A79C|nr:uncharacterized protein LOC117341041 [Pecten maximus]
MTSGSETEATTGSSRSVTAVNNISPVSTRQEVTNPGTESTTDVTTAFVITESGTSGSVNNSPTSLTDGSTASGNTGGTLNDPQNNASSVVNITPGIMESGTTTGSITISEVPKNVTSCPRFPSRLEKDTRIVTYGSKRCEMVVTIVTEDVSPMTILQVLKNNKRVVRRPAVRFRTVNDENDETRLVCKPLPTTPDGPVVFVDTVINKCQMVLKIQKVTDEDVPSNASRQKDTSTTKLPATVIKFLPVLMYLDEDAAQEIQEPM